MPTHEIEIEFIMKDNGDVVEFDPIMSIKLEAGMLKKALAGWCKDAMGRLETKIQQICED